MKRALLPQMFHEWKTNIWLVVELAIVALSIWVIISYLWIQCKGIFQPLGFNPERVYMLEVKSIPESSPYFLEEYKDKYYEDRNELVRRLRENPNVEYVSLHINFAPFDYNYQGNQLWIEGKPDSIVYFGNFRIGQPDIIKIMEIRSLTGKTSDTLEAMLSEGKVLLSPNEYYEQIAGNVEDLIGRKVYVNPSEGKEMVVGDIVERVRRSLYEYDPRGVVICPFENVNSDWGEIILKLKPGKENAFKEDFNSDPSLSKLRNVYLSNLLSLEKKGETLHREVEIDIRLLVAISFFLLITIFLGLLGSFWFRVQQRVSEIAIRKTFGASDKDLFRRILGEGMFLLIAGLLLVSACIWPFIGDITDVTSEKWYTFLAIEGITGGVMALGIILSLSYPAWRAMRIEPAVAVKEE